MPGFQMGKLRHRVRQLVRGKADMKLDFPGPSVPERQGWVVGLRIRSQGLRSSLGLAQADLLESHTCQLWRCQGSHTPTLGLSFPFYKGSKDAELPELSWSLRAQHSAWELPGMGALATPAPT